MPRTFKLLCTLLAGACRTIRGSARRSAAARKRRPLLECLETREVPSTLTQTPDGSVFLSPDGQNLTGGGSTQRVYDGSAGRATLIHPAGGGVLAQFAATRAVNFSPDFTNLAGGGNTLTVYNGRLGPLRVVAAPRGGVFAQVQKTSALYFSPDATRLTGGGRTRLLYDGRQGRAAFHALRNQTALIQLQKTGAVLQTTRNPRQPRPLYDGKKGPVQLTVTARGGVLVKLRSGAVFFSADLRNLAGGGRTRQVYNGRAGKVNLVPLASGGVLTQLSRGGAVFLSTDYTNLAGGGRTRKVYNGSQGPVQLTPAPGGGVIVRMSTSAAVLFSRDGSNLAGGGNTEQVYDGSAGFLDALPVAGGPSAPPPSTIVPVTPSNPAPQPDPVLPPAPPPQPPLITTPEGLQYQQLRAGSGRAAVRGDQVQVLYTGTLQDGTVFDSSANHGNVPLSFMLGVGQVIKGFDLGVAGMQVGAQRKLIIPAAIGYGSTGTANIPPNATLTFVVEVVAITPPPEGTITRPSGLQYQDLVAGTGAAAGIGHSVQVKYTGTLDDGTVFDSTERQGGAPFTFQLSVGAVIRGWDEGVLGMQVGGQRRLRVPAHLAYGAAGVQGVIPPNATLNFVVELVAVNTPPGPLVNGPDGLQTQDLRPGSGAGAVDGNDLRITYIGYLPDGTIFDTNLRQGGTPFAFKLGTSQVIRGMDLGMVGAQVGSQRKLVIPASLAYGSAGIPGVIPPDTTLTFLVNLISNG
jgi:peptidylprolyl isomerase